MSPVEQDIVDEFDLFDDWMAKYDHIISLGKELPAMEADLKTDDNLIRGCQSRVWLHAELVDGRLKLSANSDADIVRGLVAIVVGVFDTATPEEAASASIDFVDRLGLSENLSQTRANGLMAMIKQIKLYGTVFQALGKSGTPGR